MVPSFQIVRNIIIVIIMPTDSNITGANSKHNQNNGDLIVDFPNAGRLHGPNFTTRVRFSLVAPEIKIIQRQTSQQLASLWTSSEERANYRRSLIHDVGYTRRMLQSREQDIESITNEEIAHCDGLENLLSASVCRRVVNKKREHREAVMSEARRQAVLGIHDEESMRLVSERISMWSVERARTVAEEYFLMQDEVSIDD